MNLNNLKSWIPVSRGSDFPIQNLPYGIFSTKERSPRAGIAIGDLILDLALLHERNFLSDCGLPAEPVFLNDTLNGFIRLGKPTWQKVRARLIQLLEESSFEIRNDVDLFVKQNEASMHMPVHVPDYTDFYSSMEHASNVGKMFRPDQPSLLPNWKHMPIGYHGRASSIMISGTSFQRPKGQFKPVTEERPIFGPTRQLDIELEMAFILGRENPLGNAINAAEAEDYIFGMVLFNDYSARDIQAWEYVPLGPFLGKNFFSSVSPWIVTLDALEPFRVEGPAQDEPLLPYLKTEGKRNFDIGLEVFLTPQNGVENRICRSNHKFLYWNIAQQLAHHTVNGCNMRVGDMCASGTISAPDESGFGSMLELSWRGQKPIQLQHGGTRTFIEDGDTLTIRGYCDNGDFRIGFGEVTNQILPAS
jgi:fumarylacetoacetase